MAAKKNAPAMDYIVDYLKKDKNASYAEIAETMALPPTTIKGLLERGTRELRARLASLGEAAR